MFSPIKFKLLTVKDVIFGVFKDLRKTVSVRSISLPCTTILHTIFSTLLLMALSLQGRLSLSSETDPESVPSSLSAAHHVSAPHL